MHPTFEHFFLSQALSGTEVRGGKPRQNKCWEADVDRICYLRSGLAREHNDVRVSILIQPLGVNDQSKDPKRRAKWGPASRGYEGRLPERGLAGPQMPAQRAGAARLGQITWAAVAGWDVRAERVPWHHNYFSNTRIFKKNLSIKIVILS